MTARPTARGHPLSAGPCKHPGLALISTPVRLPSRAVSELNYFRQPLVIYCGVAWLLKTRSNLPVGLRNLGRQRAGQVWPGPSRNQDTGVPALALLTQYLGQAIQPAYASVLLPVKWAQPHPSQGGQQRRSKNQILSITWGSPITGFPRELARPLPSTVESRDLRVLRHWWEMWNEVFFFFFNLIPGRWVRPMTGLENNAQHTVGAPVRWR